MKKLCKLLGIIALVAVIGFVAACSNGGGGGPGSSTQRPAIPLKETYVSYDNDGNKYELVITEDTTGRTLDPNRKYTYSLTITFTNGKTATSTGTAEIKSNIDNAIEITLTHSSGETVTVTVSSRGEDINIIVSFDDKIPVDNGEDILPPRALPYILNEAGTGYILINGKDIVNQEGKADIPEYPPFDKSKPVTIIGGGAFSKNKDLKSVTIPASVTEIEGWEGAFSNCTNLTTVNFAPNGKLKLISSAAFENCTSLTSIEIPASVTEIINWANFGGCTNLKTVTFTPGSQLKTLGGGVFLDCTSLVSIEIPASVTALADWGTFMGCTNLTTVTFAPNSQLKTIGYDDEGGGTFQDCTSLKNITIPAGVTSIGAMAFDSCTSITSIIIPASVTAFGILDGGWGGHFAGWTSSQTINVRGHASEEAAAAAWGWEWLAACDAVRKYWNGSDYQ